MNHTPGPVCTMLLKLVGSKKLVFSKDDNIYEQCGYVLANKKNNIFNSIIIQPKTIVLVDNALTQKEAHLIVMICNNTIICC